MPSSSFLSYLTLCTTSLYHFPLSFLPSFLSIYFPPFLCFFTPPFFTLTSSLLSVFFISLAHLFLPFSIFSSAIPYFLYIFTSSSPLLLSSSFPSSSPLLLSSSFPSPFLFFSFFFPFSFSYIYSIPTFPFASPLLSSSFFPFRVKLIIRICSYYP